MTKVLVISLLLPFSSFSKEMDSSSMDRLLEDSLRVIRDRKPLRDLKAEFKRLKDRKAQMEEYLKVVERLESSLYGKIPQEKWEELMTRETMLRNHIKHDEKKLGEISPQYWALVEKERVHAQEEESQRIAQAEAERREPANRLKDSRSHERGRIQETASKVTEFARDALLGAKAKAQGTSDQNNIPGERKITAINVGDRDSRFIHSAIIDNEDRHIYTSRGHADLSNLYDLIGGNQTILRSVVGIFIAREEDQKDIPHCSGALINEKTVVTALHCIQRKLRIGQREVDADISKHVFASVPLGNRRWAHYSISSVKTAWGDSRYINHSAYRSPNIKEEFMSGNVGIVQNDWAILTLRSPVRDGLVPSNQFFEIENSNISYELGGISLPSRVGLVTTAGYPFDKLLDRDSRYFPHNIGRVVPHLPNLYYQGNCTIFGHLARYGITTVPFVGVHVTNCDVAQGQSGGPVFRIIEGRPHLSGIISASYGLPATGTYKNKVACNDADYVWRTFIDIDNGTPILGNDGQQIGEQFTKESSCYEKVQNLISGAENFQPRL